MYSFTQPTTNVHTHTKSTHLHSTPYIYIFTQPTNYILTQHICTIHWKGIWPTDAIRAYATHQRHSHKLNICTLGQPNIHFSPKPLHKHRKIKVWKASKGDKHTIFWWKCKTCRWSHAGASNIYSKEKMFPIWLHKWAALIFIIPSTPNWLHKWTAY